MKASLFRRFQTHSDGIRQVSGGCRRRWRGGLAWRWRQARPPGQPGTRAGKRSRTGARTLPDAVRRFLPPTLVTACVLSAAESAPAPAPIKVGCYYFPGFFDASRWTPIRAYGRPTPQLGFYRDGAPGVSDWHIAWATANGISFFVFDWYYNHRSGANSRHNTALDQGFLTASRRDAMEFALMWCNEEPATTPRLRPGRSCSAGRLWDGTCHEPNYLRVGAGRPGGLRPPAGIELQHRLRAAPSADLRGRWSAGWHRPVLRGPCRHP